MDDRFPFRRVLTLDPLIEYWRGVAASASPARAALAAALLDRVAAAPALARPITDPNTLEEHRDVIDALMTAVFPDASGDETFGAAMAPFEVRPVYQTPAFRAFGLLDTMRSLHPYDTRMTELRTTAAYHIILARVYQRDDLDTHIALPLTVRDPETGLDRHFSLTIEPHFLRVVTVGAKPELSDAQIQRLLSDRTNLPLWRELIPAEPFELHGFAIFNAVDVTERHTIAALTSDLLRTDGMAGPGRIDQLEARLRVLFRRPELRLGLIAVDRDHVDGISGGKPIGRSLLLAQGAAPVCPNRANSYYARAFESRSPLWVSDLECCAVQTGYETSVRQLGVRNLMLAPLAVGDRIIGMIELASPNPGDLHALNGARVDEVVSLFSAALKRVLDEQETRVQAIIRQEYTAIHPAVEWRFREAAAHFLEHAGESGARPGSESIVFENVYPLYGLSDVRASSSHRSEAIQADLLEQLALARAAIAAAHADRALPALAELEHRLAGFVAGIDAGLRSGDEMRVLDFLRLELEDVLRQLHGLGPGTKLAVSAYQDALDPGLGFVYRQRRRFEESVTLINETIGATIDREQAEAQAMFPHYFEKFKTDGVDYNIYIGASLQRDHEFQPLYLRNLRLWQLMLMCRIVWALDRIAPRLSVPLEVAHLILVQSAPLAIRFRADEKRFDVDGAYNIRYEIVKKRIDKARVRGTREQLTQPGHLAIVYSHPREAVEYAQYLDFLRATGYVTGPAEELELEDLQGARGLEALRIRVAPEPSAADPTLPERALALASTLPTS